MSPTITNAERRSGLVRKHRLAPPFWTDDVAAISNDLVALHSSDPASVYLSAGARMISPSVEGVEQAIYRDRSLVRQHAMRRTIWVMTREIADLAYASAGAKVAANEQKRLVQWLAAVPSISDPDAWLTNANAEIITLLRGAGTSTREVGKLLPHLGVELDISAGNGNRVNVKAHGRILNAAAFDRRIIRGRPTGSWISSEYRWEVPDTWLPAPQAQLDGRLATKNMVHRWLERFGPATETDIQWWMGSTKTAIRTALSDAGALSVQLENGDAAWVAGTYESPGHLEEPWVALLPGLDPTPMGWKQREWYLPSAVAGTVFDHNANVGPTVWIDGQIAGGWAQLPSGDIVTDLPRAATVQQGSLLTDAIERTQLMIAEASVRPRFPSPSHKALLGSA